ncbi:hypothetical protein AAT16_13530 [Salinicoccus halodurans]|uniref:DUF1700 domain-containing protein n=2 Tax=Salinicoccus halodurans TaxID=407035 RepID=A0ABN4G7P7_9STAP|nr:hypothetical protein AAT16_13530 [Salinicoccus halodurans]
MTFLGRVRMKLLEKEYKYMYQTLDEEDQMLFEELEGIIDSHHSRTEDKWDVLHEMMTHLYESEGESFKSLFGKQPENYALELGTSMEKGKSRYWKDFGMLFAYYTFIYSLCVLIAGSFTVSWLLLALPLLIALMIPMMNKGIRQQAFKGPASQTSTTITFLLLFGITKVFIIFTFHDYFSPFLIVNYDGDVISVIKIACFTLLITVFFITLITSRRISMKFLSYSN